MLSYFIKAAIAEGLLRYAAKNQPADYWEWSPESPVVRTVFRLLQSNHARRIADNRTLLKRNVKRVLRGKPIAFNILDGNLSYSPLALAQTCDQSSEVFLVGDSHVEFLARRHDRCPLLNQVRTTAIWLGPKTFNGIFYEGSAKTNAAKTVDYIKCIRNNGARQSRSLCALSLGNIDIRCFFHQAIVFGLVASEDEMFEKFEASARHIIAEMRIEVAKHYPEMAFGVYEILYCNGEAGYFGTDRKHMRKLLKQEGFPTLGALDDRIRWTTKANAILRTICEDETATFIETNRFLKGCEESQTIETHISADTLHVTDLEVVSAILQNTYDRVLARDPGGSFDRLAPAFSPDSP